MNTVNEHVLQNVCVLVAHIILDKHTNCDYKDLFMEMQKYSELNTHIMNFADKISINSFPHSIVLYVGKN